MLIVAPDGVMSMAELEAAGWTVEKAFTIGELDLVAESSVERALLGSDEKELEQTVNLIFDSGCTCVCVPIEEAWLFSRITSNEPKTALQVASA